MRIEKKQRQIYTLQILRFRFPKKLGFKLRKRSENTRKLC